MPEIWISSSQCANYASRTDKCHNAVKHKSKIIAVTGRAIGTTFGDCSGAKCYAAKGCIVKLRVARYDGDPGERLNNMGDIWSDKHD